MPQQPDLSLYYEAMQYYNNFMIFIVLAAGVFVFWLNKIPKGKGIKVALRLRWILLLGLIVRLPVMFESFWYDEAFTSAIAQTDSLAQFFTAVRGDVHPPGYYFIVRTFTQVFGHHDFVMRLPALLSGLGMIVAMYHLGKLHGNERVGKYAALITALLPSAIYYSAEARYPMFMALMLAVAFIGIKTKREWMVILGLSAAAISHVNAWFYVIIMMTIYILNGGRKKSMMLPFASIACWLPFAFYQAQDVADGFWILRQQPFLHIIEMTIGTSFPDSRVGLVVATITTTVIFLATWQWRKNATWSWLAMVAAVPLLLWSVGVVWQPIYLTRTLLFSALLLIIPVAWWLDKYARRWLVGVGVVALVVGMSWLYLEDRAALTEEAIMMCDGYPSVYATNTHTAILAKHYLDAKVYTWIDGNSTAQTLPQSSREALFDGVLAYHPNKPVCIISQISGWNTKDELGHIAFISQVTADGFMKHTMDDSKFVYYVVMLEDF